MTTNRFVHLASSGVCNLVPYPVPARAKNISVAQSIKLASNENPYGPSPKVKQSLVEYLPELNRYPDAQGLALKTKISQALNVDIEQIVLGNGSNELLELLGQTFLGTADEVVYSEYSFVVYESLTQINEAEAIVVPTQNYAHDLPAMVAAISSRTKLVFLANPNNPTGTYFSKEQLQDFLQQVPEQVLVVLDEAYVEYAQAAGLDSVLSLLDDHPNLIVLRTFSKAYGLAGLRVGYGLAHPDVIELLNRVRQPFNVNACALLAAETAYADQVYLNEVVQLNKTELEKMQKALDKLSLAYVPSISNFLLVEFGARTDEIYQKLLAAAVIVRPVKNYGLAQYLRISIGLPAENKRCLEMLEKLL